MASDVPSEVPARGLSRTNDAALTHPPHARVRRFLFTRNTSECGILTNFTDDPSPPIAVLVDNGLKLHVGVASAFFFVLSALAHGLWVYAYFNRRLWEKLFGWLVDAWVPTRWAECALACLHPARTRHSAPKCSRLSPLLAKI